VLGASVGVGVLAASWVNGLLVVILLLSLYTLYNRVRHGLAETR